MPHFNLRQAEVTAIAAGGTCTIKVAGSTQTIAGIKSLVAVVVGDIVWVAQQGSSLIVVNHIDTGWHLVGGSGEPAFAHSWVNYGTWGKNATFRKVGGRVQIAGLVKSGTVIANTGSSVFTLPVGFRPKTDSATTSLIFPTLANDLLGQIRVYETGEVCAWAGSNVWFSLDTVSFVAEQ
jgi:hypothetical protein